MLKYYKYIIIIIFILFACEDNNTELIFIPREEAIPESAIKMTPETDQYPPILYSTEWYDPVPLEGVINTAGGEDSPFIPLGKDELYFFFTPDVSVRAEDQLTDGATGIYFADLTDEITADDERIILQDPDKLALDGCTFVKGDTMWFCSAREGYSGLHWFTAEKIDGEWINWQVADFNSDYAVGELHIHDNMLYYHSAREGGKGNYDIWQSKLIDNEWSAPVNIEKVNTESMDGFPFINNSGDELWFTRTYLGTPAIYRSKKVNDNWQDPELILSQFAGEPTLDSNGNIYFVHHFYQDGIMIEADIYIAKKK